MKPRATQAIEQALGYLPANRGGFTTNSAEFSSVSVSNGMAEFVPENALESHPSASTKSVKDIRFSLIDPSEATDTTNGALMFENEDQTFIANDDVSIDRYDRIISGAETVTMPASRPNGTVVDADRGSVAVVGMTKSGKQVGPQYEVPNGKAVVPAVANNPPHHWAAINLTTRDHAQLQFLPSLRLREALRMGADRRHPTRL